MRIKTSLSLLRSSTSNNVLWAILGNLGRVVSQGAYFIILAKTLGVEQFGVFSSAFALVNVASPFSMFGSGNLLVMNVARDRDSFDRFFGNCIIFLTISGFILLAALLVLAGFILPSTPVLIVLFLGMGELVFYRLVDIAAQAFQAFENMKLAANTYLLASFFRLALSIAFVFIPVHNAVAWSFIYLISNISVGVFALLYLTKLAGLPKFDKSLITYTFKNGWAYSLGISATSIYSDVDKIYLSRFDSLAVTGYYNAAYRIILLLITPLQALVYALNTRMFQSGQNGVSGLIPLLRRILYIILIYSLVSFLLLLLFRPLIPKILGAGFSSSSVVVVTMFMIVPLASINYVIGDVLMGAGYQKARSVIQIIVAIFASIFGFFVIQKYSWQGGIMTSVCSQSVLLLSLVIILIHFVLKEKNAL
ncbi:oligosaccharide flippase family protein [Deinococcus sp.]|uniref:oligosaccharide flippase family protein n=1 Tax=Deinococcus sp. TaxID=47478 RepID=UPI003CC50A8C